MAHGPTIVLSWAEVLRALGYAARRYGLALQLGRKPKYGQTKERVPFDNITGCFSEAAHAVVRGLPYAPGDDPDGTTGDVGGDHVRGTTWETGHLQVYPGDPRHGRFVLYVGPHGPRWRNAGWMRASEALTDRYHRRPGDGKQPPVRFEVWYVPQGDLHPWPPPDLAPTPRPASSPYDWRTAPEH